MANERWNSPFPHTIAFVLFKEHFTELNYVYWAHVPAASTIEKKALEALKSEDADPKRYFLIPDKDDRRIPNLCLSLQRGLLFPLWRFPSLQQLLFRTLLPCLFQPPLSAFGICVGLNSVY